MRMSEFRPLTENEPYLVGLFTKGRFVEPESYVIGLKYLLYA